MTISDRPSASEPSDFVSLEPEPLCGTSKAPDGWTCTRQLGHPGPCAGVLDPLDDGAPPLGFAHGFAIGAVGAIAVMAMILLAFS